MATTAATFGAGCFWGIEAAFRQLQGVVSTEVGYMGGTVEEPSYRQVCSGRTGHAEVVQVTFDPDRLSYDDVLAVLWDNHDPTTRDRQGPDVGTQYRSAIFVHDGDQEAAARRSIEALEASARFRRPVVTEVTQAGTFWPAEDHHQQYLEKRGLSTCRI